MSRAVDQNMNQGSDSSQYPHDGRFVAELAGPLLELPDPQPCERILDLRCGDGLLAERIAGYWPEVIGADASESMIATA